MHCVCVEKKKTTLVKKNHFFKKKNLIKNFGQKRVMTIGVEEKRRIHSSREFIRVTQVSDQNEKEC
jgi:hypothetical protein